MSNQSPDVNAAYPECKLPASLAPEGFFRFEITEAQAETLLAAVQEQYDSATGDDPVVVAFEMDLLTLGELTESLQQLVTNLPRQGVKQVTLTETPEIAVSVLVDKDQMKTRVRENQKTLQLSDGKDVYAQEFEVSQNSAILFIRQLEEALDGAADPVDAIDVDEIRDSVTSS